MLNSLLSTTAKDKAHLSFCLQLPCSFLGHQRNDTGDGILGHLSHNLV